MRNTPFILFCFSAVFLFIPSKWFNSSELLLLTLAKPIGFFQAGDTAPKDKTALLEKEVADLKTELTQVYDENRKLTKQLKEVTDFIESQPAGARIKSAYQLITCNVLINYDISIWRSSLTLNRGSSDGIEVGLPVISGNYLVGKVSGVSPLTSRVQLLTDPAFRSKANVTQMMPLQKAPEEKPSAQKRSRNEVPTPASGGTNSASGKKPAPAAERNLQSGTGVLCGLAFNQCFLKWVSREVKVTRGWDVLTAPDLEGAIPAGIIIGKTDTIDQEGYFYTVTVKPAVDFYSLDSVIVLKPKK